MIIAIHYLLKQLRKDFIHWRYHAGLFTTAFCPAINLSILRRCSKKQQSNEDIMRLYIKIANSSLYCSEISLFPAARNCQTMSFSPIKTFIWQNNWSY